MKTDVYKVKDLAEMFETTPQTIRNEIERGRLRCFRVGNEARFTNVHLEEYMMVRNLGKTSRELQLEEEIESLKVAIESKDKVIENIKHLLLKEA